MAAEAINFTPGVSQRLSSGADQFFNLDRSGSASDITDSSGNLYAARTWDAYGVQKSGGHWNFLRGWHADGNYEEDTDANLKLLGYRYYDPSIGRFLSPDPAGIGSNWYAYCGNDPVNAEDPLGLMAYDINDGAFDNPHDASSDNLTGWWTGGFNFTLEGVSDGLTTGTAGMESGLSFGLIDSGGHENDIGFGGARNLGRVGGACLAVAGGACGLAKLGFTGAVNLATAGGGTAALEIEEEDPDLVAQPCNRLARMGSRHTPSLLQCHA